MPALKNQERIYEEGIMQTNLNNCFEDSKVCQMQSSLDFWFCYLVCFRDCIYGF